MKVSDRVDRIKAWMVLVLSVEYVPNLVGSSGKTDGHAPVNARALSWTTSLLSQETLLVLHAQGAFRTSLCQHARIGITAVLYTHTTVALY